MTVEKKKEKKKKYWEGRWREEVEDTEGLKNYEITSNNGINVAWWKLKFWVYN